MNINEHVKIKKNYEMLCNLHEEGFRFIACSGFGQVYAYRTLPIRDTFTGMWVTENRGWNETRVYGYSNGEPTPLTWENGLKEIKELTDELECKLNTFIKAPEITCNPEESKLQDINSILKALYNEGFRWIASNANSKTYAYKSKPTLVVSKHEWVGFGALTLENSYGTTFEEGPVSIDELLQVIESNETCIMLAHRGYKYIARDNTGKVYAYGNKPLKRKGIWSAYGDHTELPSLFGLDRSTHIVTKIKDLMREYKLRIKSMIYDGEV